MKEKAHGNKDGSITVFLSLVLMLVLSLIMTVIEGARFYAAKVMAERALTTAMDSVLAEFYGPLMKEYHLLGLNAGYGGSNISRGEIENKLSDYMSYTFLPNSGLTGAKPGVELYNITLDDVCVEDIVRITEHGGKLFVHEACGYMKYKVAGDGLELLLNKLNLLEQPKKISYIYEKKIELEEQLAAIDEGILDLMEQLDGISTGKNGLNTDKKGNIKTVGNFVKKICYGTPDMEKVGINNSFIFEALKNSYYDPAYSFEKINSNLDEIDSLSSQINDCIIQQEEVRQLLSDEEERLARLEEILALQKEEGNDTEDTEAEIKACKENKKELESDLKDIQDNISSLNKMMDSYIRDTKSLISDISDVADHLLNVTNDARDTVISLMDESDRVKPLIANYENVLKTESEDLDETTREGLYEDLGELKKYEPDSGYGYDFKAMKEIISGNASILSEVKDFLSKGETGLSSGEYKRTRDYVYNASLSLSKYRISDLKLDYSSLVENRDADNPHDKIKSVVTGGLMELVLDTGKLSEASINNDNLPSHSMAANEAGSFSFKELIGGMKAGKGSGMGGLFSGYNEMGLSGVFIYGINELAAKLLFQEYLDEHFYRMPFADDETGTRKPTVLSYEQEYLIAGYKNDKDNLSSVVTRIILLRTLFNFISVLGNKEKMNEAKLTATALVGFTGLYILVILTQTLLLILLAFSEALVDTCAILEGKELPVFKKQFEMGIYDMFILNREYIKQKADGISKDSKGITLGYQEYLKIFLFFKDKEKTSYRCMDLIQENIRLNYDENFNMQNCLFGFDARADFTIKSKFITIPHIQKYIHGKDEADYSVKAGYSY